MPEEMPGAAPADDGAPPSEPARLNGHGPRPESVAEAAERVVEAARAIVLDHLTLALLEVRALGRSLARATALVLVGAVFLGATWGLAMATLYLFVGDAVAPWARLAGITAATGVVAGALLASGARQLRGRSPEAP